MSIARSLRGVPLGVRDNGGMSTLMMTPTLQIGPHTVQPPVVLAPMAGITNAPFRTLCREFSGGKGLFVSEMITTRALVERNEKTMQLIQFDASETPRSIQLYGVDPATVGKAVRMIAEEDLADHIDLNFGCPVPKVTRKGGGSALPYKRNLLRAILREAVSGAGDALRMMRETGCDGVVVGRGCLGRPWLFGDLVAAFEGTGSAATPSLREV